MFYEWVRRNPPGREYKYRKKFYYTDFGDENLLEIYLTLFVLILDITIEVITIAYELLRDQTTVPEYVLAVEMSYLDEETRRDQQPKCKKQKDRGWER